MENIRSWSRKDISMLKVVADLEKRYALVLNAEKTSLNKTNMEKKYTYKGKEYRIVHFVKMRVKGDWVDGVLYEAMYLNPDGRYFVRTKEEFDELFKEHKV
jgi:nicotinic acid phosphoribosyltransferase